MRLNRSLLLPFLAAAVAAPAMLVAPPAQAQNFFERLFGIKPERPPVPPRGVPEAPTPAPAPAAPGEPGQPPAAEAPRPAPQPARPVVLKTPSEDGVLGQDLQLNGLSGNLKLERSGTAVTARIKLPGTKISQPAESCTVPLGGGNPIALSTEGKPEGVPRFEAAGAECPLRFDVTEGGVLVSTLASGPVCTFSAADCATTPTGLWGPPAATLIPRAGEFDTARGVADKAVRDNYKLMTQRARREDVRPIVSEQAAFSSDREQLCRTYAREGAHGFCHLRVTENRALALATRLGANTAVPTAAVAPRRPRPKPAVEGMNPDAGVGADVAPE
ncbi:hypothetical protein ACLBX9_25955 [Methylobacterium sp. A49B]|uniref:DUF1311 domain-containing protein n=1 Tax=Methylobacterium mesophilicum SR1.6/6 TaxID=908290 RepID=A0A6B9FI36_9HYPH|nr:hypothetical protein [Methylobacterium mesophilicum]QGY02193.1 hypothetical protein MMSR116_10110 [Methylobacterium mesophilicum SR1.6/6]